MRKYVIDTLAKAAVMLYYTLLEAEMHDLELVHRVYDLVKWAKAHHKYAHGCHGYETLYPCTVVADCWRKKDGGR
eukprot:evm.model.NODE_20518_length_48474_cov_83.695778.12